MRSLRYLHVNEAWSQLTALSFAGHAEASSSEVIRCRKTVGLKGSLGSRSDQEPSNFCWPCFRLGSHLTNISRIPRQRKSLRFVVFLSVTERDTRTKLRLKERAVELENKNQGLKLGRLEPKTGDVSPGHPSRLKSPGIFEAVYPAMNRSWAGTQQILHLPPPQIFVHRPDES